jgi:hypothetical protein
VNIDKIEQRVVRSGIYDNPTIPCKDHKQVTLLLRKLLRLWIRKCLLSRNQEAEGALSASKWLHVLRARNLCPCSRVHTICANDYIALNYLAAFQRHGALLDIDIYHPASGPKYRWLSLSFLACRQTLQFAV